MPRRKRQRTEAAPGAAAASDGELALITAEMVRARDGIGAAHVGARSAGGACVTNVTGLSRFAGRAVVWWTPGPGCSAATTLVVCAIDDVSGATVELARESGDAIGTVIVDTRMGIHRHYRFYVKCAQPSRLSASRPSAAVMIEQARFSWSRMKKIGVWRDDCSALAKYLTNPSCVPSSPWSANEHLSVLRAIHTRGLGLLATPRLARAAQRRSPALFAAQRAVVTTGAAMALVLRYATPRCTPTPAELRNMLGACCAAREERAFSLADFLGAGVDPNVRIAGTGDRASPKGLPLLHIAAQRGDVENVTLLLKAGAKRCAAFDGAKRRSALCIAAWHGHRAVVVALLAARIASVDAVARELLNEGDRVATLTAICAAARRGHADVVKILIAAGADPERVAKTADPTSEAPPLCWAARNGHADVVAALLAGGAAASHPTFAPLCDAAAAGHTAVVEHLLGVGVNADQVGRLHSETPPANASALLAAARNGHVDVVAALLRAGADKNLGGAREAECEGTYSPLWVAAECNRSACVAALLAAGVDVDRAVTVACGGTPLVVAARNGHAGIVAQLLLAGSHADYAVPRVQRSDARWTTAHRKCPMTPLHVAAEHGHLDAVRVLLESGADNALRNGGGSTAVMLAEVNDFPAVVALLSATNPVHARARKARKIERKFVLERSEAKALPLYCRQDALVGKVVWVPPEDEEGWEKVQVTKVHATREYQYDVVYLWSGNPDHSTGAVDEWESADFDSARCMPTRTPLHTRSPLGDIEKRVEALFAPLPKTPAAGSGRRAATRALASPDTLATKGAVLQAVGSRLREIAPASSGPLVGDRALDLLARKVAKSGGSVSDAVDICRCVLLPFIPFVHACASARFPLTHSRPRRPARCCTRATPTEKCSSTLPPSSGAVFSTPRNRMQLSRRGRWRLSCATPLGSRCTSE